MLPHGRLRRYISHTVVLGLLIASLSPGCAPNAAPPAADTVTPTPAPIGTVVTPVSAILSLTPIVPPTGVVLVLITTVTPGGTVVSGAAAAATPAPPQPPDAAVTASSVAAPVAQQAPEQIASAGRVTSVRLSSTEPVQLPCPDPRVVIGVAPVPDMSETTLHCQALDASQVQPPPGPIVGGMVFRLFTDSAPAVTLPSAASIGIAYGDASLESDREADVVIGHLEGTAWVPVPGQQIDQPSDYTSATIGELGSYALYVPS